MKYSTQGLSSVCGRRRYLPTRAMGSGPFGGSELGSAQIGLVFI